MGKPAARLGDMTAHGGAITGPGCPTVLIGKMPAATMGDMHVCPMVTPGVPPIPHVGGPLVGPVPPTVLIGKKPAACVGDMAICVGPPSTILPPGCPTVLLGQAGGGGGGGGGGGAKDAQAAKTESANSVNAVEGTETLPIEIQRVIAQAAQVLTEQQTQEMVEQIQQAYAQSGERSAGEEQQPPLTLADIVEILEAVEAQEGYEAARFFASHLDYSHLCYMARSGLEGNDPNQMPTRFMLLPYTDDSTLQQIDEHPDNFEGAPEHLINIANLRKGLKLLGYDCQETGPFDEELLHQFYDYLIRSMPRDIKRGETHVVKECEDLGSIAKEYGLISWKYLYEINRSTIGDNPDLLKAGTELTIPQWDLTTGDEKIVEKGADPHTFIHGMRYRYVWVPYSITISDKDDRMLDESRDSYMFTLVDTSRQPEEVIFEKTFSACNEIQFLVPYKDDFEERVEIIEEME